MDGIWKLDNVNCSNTYNHVLCKMHVQLNSYISTTTRPERPGLSCDFKTSNLITENNGYYSQFIVSNLILANRF
jgi:hypothetical protein